MFHNLLDGAIFIADAHYNKNRQELKTFLLNLPDGISQIYFMGDIFDFLACDINYFKTQNQELIDIINTLSLQYEIIYFEGNHDFNLSLLFPHINIFTREEQPILFKNDETKYLFAHGDIGMGRGYELYINIIKNRAVQKFLNFIDINNWLTKKIDLWLQQKNIYHEFEDFEKLANSRLSIFSTYDFDFLIEGHFHQGKKYKNYINLPTFSNKHYLIFTKGEFIQQSI